MTALGSVPQGQGQRKLTHPKAPSFIMATEGRGEEDAVWLSTLLASQWGSRSLPSRRLGRGGVLYVCAVAGAFELTGPYVSPSQSDIGFGKLETYVKLDKLGEVRGWARFSAQPGRMVRRDRVPP